VATLDNQGAKKIASNPIFMVLVWIVPSVRKKTRNKVSITDRGESLPRTPNWRYAMQGLGISDANAVIG
jgi:hypothetical protein